MLPAFVLQRELVIYLTGIAEAVIAFGLFTERRHTRAAIAAAVLLVAFLPANVYAAMNYLGAGEHKLGPGCLWVRIPLQIFLLAWALWPAIRPDRSRRQVQ